jgi:DNA-binding transcriptional LysR family regulator
MDRFVSMSIFTRVVERGSFVAAAEGSGMTATMVGNHIRSLEDRLGARLLNRTTRQQSLTDTGRNYYEQCVNILAQVRAAEGDARDIHERPRGRLRGGVPR